MRATWLLLVLLACKQPPERAPTPEAPPTETRHDAAAADATASAGPNLVLIMIDTLRADRLGVAGYRRDGKSLTPHLDAFAETAVRFTHAYAQASNTPRSFPSVMTSRLPSHVAFHKTFHNFPGVLPENVMLFEVLAQAGLYTVGFSSHFYFLERRTATQGFAEYDNSGALTLADSNADYAAPRIVPKVTAKLDELARNPRRFALFVHLFEPHSTYIDHPEFPPHLTGEEGLAERYDYEIAIEDQWIGKILDELDATGLSKNTIVIVFSDHGEAFGVHAFQGRKAFFHGQTLYDEILRVPLLIRIPSVRPAVRNDLVALIDLAPTIVDLLGIAIPTEFQGRSLVPIIGGTALPPRPVAAEIEPTPDLDDQIRALISANGESKIITSEHGTRSEVYDLTKDPDERKDLSAREPKRTKALQQQLEDAFR